MASVAVAQAKPPNGRELGWDLGSGAGRQRIELQLDRGRVYRLTLPDSKTRAELLSALDSSGLTALVPSGGMQLANLSLAENILLPASWGRPARAGLARPVLADRVHAILAALEYEPSRAQALLAKRPEQLTPFELKLGACVRAMLCEPEVMVYDRLCEGLYGAEARRLEAFDGLFHARYPFRTSVHLAC